MLAHVKKSVDSTFLVRMKHWWNTDWVLEN